jgi:hypothetical protein
MRVSFLCGGSKEKRGFDLVRSRPPPSSGLMTFSPVIMTIEYLQLCHALTHTFQIGCFTDVAPYICFVTDLRTTSRCGVEVTPVV